MRRSDLARILDLASRIVDDDVLVIGSQAILASFSDTQLPPEATRSIEADLAFFDDPDEAKSDLVDGSIGELSEFHESSGVYGQGVSVATAVLPAGWKDRVVAFPGSGGSGRAVCLEPHDLVVSKLVRGEPKDHEFAAALIAHSLVDLDTLAERARELAAPRDAERVSGWLDSRA